MKFNSTSCEKDNNKIIRRERQKKNATKTEYKYVLYMYNINKLMNRRGMRDYLFMYSRVYILQSNQIHPWNCTQIPILLIFLEFKSVFFLFSFSIIRILFFFFFLFFTRIGHWRVSVMTKWLTNNNINNNNASNKKKCEKKYRIMASIKFNTKNNNRSPRISGQKKKYSNILHIFNWYTHDLHNVPMKRRHF